MSLYNFFYGSKHVHENSKQANPQGIRLFWSVVKWHFGRLVGLNVLFILACIPIVTIPCAMTAMSKVLGLFLTRRICYPLYHFRRAFIDEWKRSTAAGGALLLSLIALLIGAWFYPRMGLSFGWILGGLCLALAVLVLAASIYLFPMIAFTDLPFASLLQNAFSLSMICLPYTLVALAGSALILAVSYLGLPFTVVIMPVLGCSLIGLACNQAAWHALKTYVLVAQESDESSSQE
ncbi:hypothetical protein KIM372_05030 [Bombiscardovia nodaiensis]|uniref:DUF624 domain-containing protein n=1 Tax=Bombiscardovia nodaiensis TaxID=2932181 RepID=A0ABM8B6X7_9BIFI|nr:hypothetical protein KIM372_05030 [Bombiscardovia nodaiensis]